MTNSEAIEVLKKNYPDPCYGSLREAVDVAIEALSKEQRKGEWIDEGLHVDEYGPHVFRCSECGEHIIGYNVDSFCRWCGADMRGEESESN